MVRNRNCCDILSRPKVQGWILQSLTRGAVVAVEGEAENGWQKTLLADGRGGYVQSSILGEHYTSPCCTDEAELRRAIAEAAMLYQGTHYRWGGKSPLGIDCSGLASMAYMLCGILIYRDANIVEGFPIHEIPRERMQTGDLLFFPGHVAVYLGNGRYCHSTGRAGDDGFTINSFNPNDSDFRADLAERLTGSWAAIFEGAQKHEPWRVCRRQRHLRARRFFSACRGTAPRRNVMGIPWICAGNGLPEFPPKPAGRRRLQRKRTMEPAK